MSNPIRICLVGATGLIGSTMIEQAVHRQDVRIVGVARREAKLPKGARMEMLLAPVEGWADAIAASRAKVLVCALGTTIRRVGGDHEAFRAVDRDLVIACGKAARDAGIEHMIVVSSVGADGGAKNFYLRTKGEMEQGLMRLRLRRLDILRPGLLRGPRADRRPLEMAAALASPAMDLLLHGKYRKYRSIRAEALVRAIFALARQKAGGQFVREWDSIQLALRRGGELGVVAGNTGWAA